jgi:hypothetical protein
VKEIAVMVWWFLQTIKIYMYELLISSLFFLCHEFPLRGAFPSTPADGNGIFYAFSERELSA